MQSVWQMVFVTISAFSDREDKHTSIVIVV